MKLIKFTALCVGVILLSSKAKSQNSTPENNALFNAFKQGTVDGGGNCASIALIKASIGTYGVGHVFTSKKDDIKKKLEITLRNGDTYQLSYDEISRASAANGFVIKSSENDASVIKAYADTCFAIMVKVNEKLKNEDLEKKKLKNPRLRDSIYNFDNSLSELLNGYNTPHVFQLLGVKNHVVNNSELPNLANAIFYNSYHAVYSSYGYYDETKYASGYAPNRKFNNNRFGLKCVHYGCGPHYTYILD